MKIKESQEVVFEMLMSRGFAKVGSGRYVRHSHGQLQLAQIEFDSPKKEYTFNIGITFEEFPNHLTHKPLVLARADVAQYFLYTQASYLKAHSENLWWKCAKAQHGEEAAHEIQAVCERVLDKLLIKWGNGLGLFAHVAQLKTGEPVLKGEAHDWMCGNGPMLSKKLLILAFLHKHHVLAQQLAPYTATHLVGAPRRQFVTYLSELARKKGAFEQLSPSIALIAEGSNQRP